MQESFTDSAQSVNALALTAVLGPAGAVIGNVGLGWVGGIAAAAIGGAAAGAISTGTLKGAIIGAVGAAVTYGIGHELFTGLDKVTQIGARAVSHGVAQGTIAEISGGDFKDGFVGAAFSYIVGATVLDKLVPANDNNFGMIVARGAAEAVVGGTAAAIGGGKFANGAYSAAFVYAFNQAMDGFDLSEEGNGEKYQGKMADDIFDKSLSCVDGQLGISEIIGGSSAVSGMNILKAGTKLGPATPGTSVAARLADMVFGDMKFIGGIRLPTLTGFPGIGRGVHIRQTARVARFAGRAVPVVGWAILAVDSVSIVHCIVSD